MPNEGFIHYNDSVEVKPPDEDELIEKIVASMARMNQRIFDKHRHAVRSAHAKSHGVLKGELSIYEDLPEPLRQGLFRSSRAYPVIMRLSSAPGDIQHDCAPAAYGMGIKVIGVEGRQVIPGRAEDVTQDFLFVNMPSIPFGHASAYWKMQQAAEKNADYSGKQPPATAPTRPVLGEIFYSMAALRYGDYIAKISVTPLSENVRRLAGQSTVLADGFSAQRDFVVDFFKSQTAEYELRVQLCKDLKRMPVEDGSIEWPEDLSPYQPVAKVTLPAQDAYSPARRVYGDDRLSFNPWHCIAEHRPLGSIMRARIKTYEYSTRFRYEMNMQPPMEPRDMTEFPD